MSNFFFYPAAFAVLLATLIVVHEFGHYAMARLCGVKVLRFALGFGRIVFSRQIGRDKTEWAIALFPLGGYVKMLDGREGDLAPEEAHRAFDRQTVGKRMAIVAAGPGANFLLAIILYWALFWQGVEEPRPLLGAPVPASVAAVAGVANGERVLKVGNNAVATWPEFHWEVVQQATAAKVLTLETINLRHEINVRHLDVSPIIEGKYEGDPLDKLGITFYRPKLAAVLGKVLPGGVADRAGLASKDEVLMVDDQHIDDWSALVQRIRAATGKPLLLTVRRGLQQLEFSVTPQLEQGVGRIGVGVSDPLTPEQRRQFMLTTIRYEPLAALSKAVTETWDKSVFTLQMMGKMLIGEVSWKNLSGPVTLADYAGQSARLGADYFIRFMALVSISLGVLNLLPVPVLDGGHLMYHIIELIKRSPVSERAMEIGQQIGMALLFSLITFAFYNDINRLLFGS